MERGMLFFGPQHHYYMSYLVAQEKMECQDNQLVMGYNENVAYKNVEVFLEVKRGNFIAG